MQLTSTIEWKVILYIWLVVYSGISIKRTHSKVDTSIRRTQYDEELIDLLCSQTISKKSLLSGHVYNVDTFLHQWCPLYRDSTVGSKKCSFDKKLSSLFLISKQKYFCYWLLWKQLPDGTKIVFGSFCCSVSNHLN